MRVRVRYVGSVQGVGFRATARSCADGLAVTGWVHNENDGSVLLEVQGTQADVGEFLDRLRARMARNIRTEDRAQVGALDAEAGFVIRR